jgi:hypothetical protein
MDQTVHRQESARQEQPNATFMSLPPELRLGVYELIPHHETKPIPRSRGKTSCIYFDAYPANPVLLQISRHIALEASPVVRESRRCSPPVVSLSILNEHESYSDEKMTGDELCNILHLLERGFEEETDSFDTIDEMPGCENTPTALLWYKALLAGKVTSPQFGESRQHLQRAMRLFAGKAAEQKRLADTTYQRTEGRELLAPFHWTHEDNNVVPGLDSFYHGCIAILRNNPSIELRLLLPTTYTRGQYEYIDDFLWWIRDFVVPHRDRRFPFQLRIVFVMQEGIITSTWKSFLRRKGDLQDFEWSIKTTKGKPVLGVD